MNSSNSALDSWSPEEIAAGRKWVAAWREAGLVMEHLRRADLKNPDTQRTITLLCNSSWPSGIPLPLRPTSGMVEMQRWFRRAAHCE